MAEPVIVVLGAGGRIGQELLPLLPNSGNVLAVSRTAHDVRCSGLHRWLHVDLADREAVATTISELGSLTAADTQVILVDLVLDRTSVAAMKRSIMASARYIAALTEQVRAQGGTCAVVSASTTAVLAPAIYQTPYGHAKRDQLASYAHLPGARLAYLLPQLVTDQPNGVTWTYRQAAHELTKGARRLCKERPSQLQLVSPRLTTPLPSPSSSWLQKLWRVVPSHIVAWTTQRDHPESHRVASHARLRLTPRALRRHVDHHVVPPSRVGRLANQLDASLTWVDAWSPVMHRTDS